MLLQRPAATVEREWLVVSSGHPCPVCGAEDECRISDDREFLCCAQRPSDWPLVTGGWLHRVSAHA
jgi:hypothetical protein